VLQGDLGRGLARPTRVLVVRSPVTVMLTFSDGRRLGGLADGTIVNDLAGEVDMYAAPVPGREGEVEWLFFLPEEDFTVELSGTGSGDFHVLMATPDGAYGYGGQAIGSGELATFAVGAAGNPSDLTLPGGAVVTARRLAADEVDAAMGITAEGVTSRPGPDLPPTGLIGDALTLGSSTLPALIGLLSLIIGGGALGVGLIYLGLCRGRGRKAK
jgi:hypothetical protein